MDIIKYKKMFIYTMRRAPIENIRSFVWSYEKRKLFEKTNI